MRALTRRARGLTLIELLVASVLLGTVLLVLVQGVSLATRVASQAHREARAIQLIESIVAQVHAGALPANEDIEGTFEEQGLPDYRWSVQSVEDGEDEDLFLLTITVYWPAVGGEQSLEVAGLFREPPEESDE